MHRRESAKGDATAPRWTVDELFSTRPQRATERAVLASAPCAGFRCRGR